MSRSPLAGHRRAVSCARMRDGGPDGFSATGTHRNWADGVCTIYVGTTRPSVGDLLAYCERDTFVMVALLGRLQQRAGRAAAQVDAG